MHEFTPYKVLKTKQTTTKKGAYSRDTVGGKVFTDYARSAMLSTQQLRPTKRKLFFQPKRMRYNNLSHYLLGQEIKTKGQNLGAAGKIKTNPSECKKQSCGSYKQSGEAILLCSFCRMNWRKAPFLS